MAQSESETVLTEHHETDNLDPRTDAPARPGTPVHIAPVQLGNITVPTPVVLSPMAGVTNWPFRVICEEYGPDGLYVAEMITARALVAHNPKALRLCHFAKSEKIRSLQLYGVNPSITEQAAKIVVDGNMADHVYLNFCCPRSLVEAVVRPCLGKPTFSLSYYSAWSPYASRRASPSPRRSASASTITMRPSSKPDTSRRRRAARP